MNILILGEYSGVSKNLKIGFSKLGHNAVIYADGDGWKKITGTGNDVTFDYKSNLKLCKNEIRGSWRLNALFQYLKFKAHISQILPIYDLVIILNYEFIRIKRKELSPKFSIKDIKKVAKVDAPIFLLACGDDYPYLSQGSKMKYWPHSNVDISHNKFFKSRYINHYKSVLNQITAVVPSMYDYAFAYRQVNKTENSFRIEKSIPFAFDTSNLHSYNELKDGKIKIYHGIIREHFKGTPQIRKALNIIKEKYGDKVDITIGERLSLNEYLKVVKETNIIIDQCKSYSYGMNAIYSMALGKVVLSGNEKECMEEFERYDIPIINIKPDVKHIIKELEKLLNNPESIVEIGIKSRKFVEEFHNDKAIAESFLSLREKYSGK